MCRRRLFALLLGTGHAPPPPPSGRGPRRRPRRLARRRPSPCSGDTCSDDACSAVKSLPVFASPPDGVERSAPSDSAFGLRFDWLASLLNPGCPAPGLAPAFGRLPGGAVLPPGGLAVSGSPPRPRRRLRECSLSPAGLSDPSADSSLPGFHSASAGASFVIDDSLALSVSWTIPSPKSGSSPAAVSS